MIKSRSSKVGDWIIAFICLLVIFVCVLPMLNVLARSLSSSDALIKGEVMLLPKGFNFNAYKYVLEDSRTTWAIAWTAILTAICTVVSMVMTTLCAYPLIYDNLRGRKIINGFILFTMYFNAGIIPNYLLLRDLHMLNKPIVLIIPSCLSVFNVIIMRSFLYNVPDSLRESAEIDGAGPIRTLISIYLPLSTPVIATLSLFYAVGRWNGFSDALMYMNNRVYYPIQLLLYNIINSLSQIDTSSMGQDTPIGLDETLKAATVMVATIPILLVYPWLQRYFISGVTLGAVKG
ncbi:MAG: carbohydrate ABC transporter permease [Bacillota bacterium]|nr:carbohydrate ABC transporter permease [Bacillota bacterium]